MSWFESVFGKGLMRSRSEGCPAGRKSTTAGGAGGTLPHGSRVPLRNLG